MAKTGVVSEGDSFRVLELQKELRLLVKAILEEEDFNVNNDNNNSNNSDSNSSSSSFVDTIDKAKELLSTLKEVKLKKTASFTLDNRCFSCPPQFRCPLSIQLMRDPVIISTGQTYDRPSIQKWLKAGHRICPITQEVLSHSLLTPHFLVREMISEWCNSWGIETPNLVEYIDEEGATEADRYYFSTLIDKMANSIEEQKAAAKELRLLTKRMPSFRALFVESTEGIPLLLSPLTQRRGSFSSGSNEIHPDLQEDVITTLLNISIHDSNKKLVAETPMVITLLIDALQYGSPETRSNAAATLFTLSALDSNKVLIGKSGAMKPLIDLLDEGHSMAVKDAASAIFNLCIIQENKARAIQEGAVRVILTKIKNGFHVDELLAIVVMLSIHQQAVEELSELEAVPCLLSIMRESSCSRKKENCVATLYAICVNDRSKLREMREEECSYGTLSQLARDGTSRAKRKASGILERLNRTLNLSHTA